MEPSFRGHRVRLSFEAVDSQDTDVNGEKPPIILLHGMAAAKEFWKNVMQPIAKATGRKVYAYDARNHGDSGWSDEFSYEAMQEDLLQFMDDLHMQKAVLIGHCMGGKVAMFFSAKWNYRSSRHSAMDGAVLPLIKDENGKYKWKTNLAITIAALSQACGPTLIRGTYPGPALFLHGTKSPYKVENDREYILKHFPGARFRAVEGAAHRIHLEFDDVFVDEIEHFINEL